MPIDTQAVMRAKAKAFDRIMETLYPQDDPSVQWENDTIEHVAEAVLSVCPLATDGDYTPDLSELAR